MFTVDLDARGSLVREAGEMPTRTIEIAYCRCAQGLNRVKSEYGCAMARKSWANLFLLLAALNLMLGVLPSNPIKIWAWVALPCCVGLSVVARRRMT